MITTKQSNQYLALVAHNVLQDRALTPTTEARALEALQQLGGQPISLAQQAELRECVDPWRQSRDGVQQQRLAQAFLDYLGAAAGVTGAEYRQGLGDGLTRALDCACGKAERVELPTRKEPLTTLTCTAYAGVFTEPRVAARVGDPLLLVFGGLEKSTPNEPTVLWLRNRSNLHDGRALRLPGNTAQAAGGAYHLVFDEAQMRALGVRPGDVLEVYQTKGERKSKPVQVKINEGGAGQIPTPALPPGDTVGAVEIKRALDKMEDRDAACVRPDQLTLSFADGCARVGSEGLALEPFAQVQLTNLVTGEKSAIVTVDGDGRFSAQVAAQHGQPLMISAADHSHGLEQSPYLRRLTFNAGDTRAILALNPRYAGSPLEPVVPELNVGRARLAVACGALEIDAGVTPGSVVTLSRSGHPEEIVRAVADERGSVSLKLPFAPCASDVIELQVANPYHDTSLDWGRRDGLRESANSTATLELQKDGSLALIEQSGRASSSAQAVRATDNVDHINDTRDVRQELQGRIGGLSLTSNSYYPRTSNTGALTLNLPRPGEVNAQVAMDPKANELVVTLRAEHGEVNGRTPVEWGRQDGVIGLAGAAARAVGDNGRLAVRFQTEDGQLVARGHLCAKVERLQDGHRLTQLELDQASLVYA